MGNNKGIRGEEQSDIQTIIASKEFKELITKAVEQGVSTDWGYDGEDEFPYELFEEDIATESVLEVLRKCFCNKE